MTCTTKCALCGEVLDQYLPYLGVERTVAAHHVGCPKRPIEVGDYVRWDWPRGGTWCEGELLSNGSGAPGQTIHRIRMDRGTASAVHDVATVAVGRCALDGPPATLRRIPRPAEAQAAPSAGCFEHCCQGTLASGAQCPVRGVAPGVALGAWRCPDHTVIRPPATALVDGMDREVCHARWMENRLAVEGGAAPPNVLKPEQIAAGRALWLQRFGAQRSAELRALVAADREAERCRVRVEVQDVD